VRSGGGLVAPPGAAAGAAINAHEAVFRFGGSSPTLGWQQFVGSKVRQGLEGTRGIFLP